MAQVDDVQFTEPISLKAQGEGTEVEGETKDGQEDENSWRVRALPELKERAKPGAVKRPVVPKKRNPFKETSPNQSQPIPSQPVPAQTIQVQPVPAQPIPAQHETPPSQPDHDEKNQGAISPALEFIKENLNNRTSSYLCLVLYLLRRADSLFKQISPLLMLSMKHTTPSLSPLSRQCSSFIP